MEINAKGVENYVYAPKGRRGRGSAAGCGLLPQAGCVEGL